MLYQGKLSVEGLRFAFVVSRFNDRVSKQLLEGAVATLRRFGADEAQWDVFFVPGVMEIVPLLRCLISRGYHALVALGAVIRGGTPHFEYIATASIQGLLQVAVGSDLPVLCGILTTNTLEEALERSGGKMGNKGSDLALAAIEMAQLYKLLGLNE